MEAISQLELPEDTQSSRKEALTGSTTQGQAIQVSRELSHENAHCLLEDVLQRLQRSCQSILMDFSHTTSIDSSGLRALVKSRRSCHEAGVEFRLVSIPECVARSIILGGFDDLFDLGEVMDLCPAPSRSPRAAASSFEDVGVCDPELIPVWRNKVAQAARKAGADNTQLCDVKIAVGEALTNAYKHGSPDKKHNLINVSCSASPEELVVEVQDEGEPFDPDAIGPPDPQVMQDHGMGIYLMRQAMDVVEFFSDCPGNTIRMTKWLNGKRGK